MERYIYEEEGLIRENKLCLFGIFFFLSFCSCVEWGWRKKKNCRVGGEQREHEMEEEKNNRQQRYKRSAETEPRRKRRYERDTAISSLIFYRNLYFRCRALLSLRSVIARWRGFMNISQSVSFRLPISNNIIVVIIISRWWWLCLLFCVVVVPHQIIGYSIIACQWRLDGGKWQRFSL